MKKVMPFLLPLYRSMLFIVAGLFFMTITNQSLEETSKWWSIICIICNIITIITLLTIFNKEGICLKALIKEKTPIKYTIFVVILMVLVGVGGMYGFAFIIYGYIPVTMIQPIPIWLAFINLLLLPLTIVLAELPLYFGYSLNKIENITGSKKLAIAYPMFFYALQHSFIPLLFDWKHIVFRFLSFLPLLIILSFLYVKKRNLKTLMIGHGILDFATGLQIVMTSIFPVVYEMMQIQ